MDSVVQDKVLEKLGAARRKLKPSLTLRSVISDKSKVIPVSLWLASFTIHALSSLPNTSSQWKPHLRNQISHIVHYCCVIPVCCACWKWLTCMKWVNLWDQLYIYISLNVMARRLKWLLINKIWAVCNWNWVITWKCMKLEALSAFYHQTRRFQQEKKINGNRTKQIL